VTGKEKTNGQKGAAGFLFGSTPPRPAAFTEPEASQSIIEAYRYQHHRIVGYYPGASSQKDKETVKKALQSRPRGTTLLSETSAVMKFIETMLPGESLDKLLGRYMNKAILLSGTDKPFVSPDNQTRVPDPREETAVDTPAAAGEMGRDTAPEQEHEAPDTVIEDKNKEILFEAVAEEYMSDAGRSRIVKDVSLAGERLKCKEYLKPFMERRISSITLFEVKELLAGMHGRGCSAEEGDTVYKIFCGIITKASEGRYAGLIDTEILRIDPHNLFAILDGESRQKPNTAKDFPDTENAEIREQIAGLCARVDELTEKIAFISEPLRKSPDPGKYVSAREFYQVIRERRKVG